MQVFEGELGRLRRENAALKDQLQRALKELKFYQIRYPSAYTPGNRADDEELPPWKTSPEVMTPLLEAYDTRISELEHFTSGQAENLKISQEKMEILVVENEKLRAAQLENLQRAAQDPSSFSSPLNEELLHEMNERVEILMTENALMVEQKAVMSAELERLQDDYEKCAEELADLTKTYEDAQKNIVDLTNRLPQAELDRQRATGEVARASEALGKAIAEADELREQLAIWKDNCNVAEESLRDARKALKALRDNAEEEGLSCVRRTKAAEDRVKELHGMLHSRSQELESLQESNRKLRRDYQSTRQDAEGMLQVMSAQERQIGDYAAREAQVEALSRECKERIEEAMIARDQAISRENQLQRLNDRLLDEKRQDVQSKQSEVDDAVIQTRQRAEQKIKALEEQLADMATRCAQSKYEEEQVRKDFLSAKEALERLRALAEEERRSFDASQHALEERLKHTEVSRNEDAVRRREIQEQNKSLRSTIDGLRTQVENNRVQLTDRDFARDKEISNLKLCVKEAQAAQLDASKALHRKTKELEDFRQEAAEQLSLLEKKRDDDVNMHRRRAEEADAKMREFETGASGEARRSKFILDQIKDKFSVTLQQLETQLEKEKAENKRLGVANRELAESVRVVADEKNSLDKEVSSLKSKNARLRGDIQEAQATVSELTEQLTTSFEARELAVKSSIRELAKVNTAAKLKSRVNCFLPTGNTSNLYFSQGDEIDKSVNDDFGSADSEDETKGGTDFEEVMQVAHKTFLSPGGGNSSN